MSSEDPYKDDETPVPRAPRQVGIYGSATTALRTAPVPGEAGWEVWSIGLYDRGDADRLFEMHADPVVLRGEDGGRLAGLQAAGCPVYMQRHWPEIPRSLPYPKAEIKAALGMEDVDLYAGTAVYMMAMAVVELAAGDAIGLFGIEALHDSHHAEQRPALWALREVARAKGIGVTTAVESTLFRQKEYGLEVPLGLSVEALQAMKDEYMRQRDRARTEVATFNGAMQAIDHALETHKHALRGGVGVW